MPRRLTRREVLKIAGLTAGSGVLAPIRRSLVYAAAANPVSALGVSFTNVAKSSGLSHKTIYGGEDKNVYLLETTGCGAAFYDYDNDGWLDIFLVNGSRLEGFPKGQEPISHLYRNNRDGTFTDVTEKAGLIHAGWGQGCCIGDFDNDGFDDLFVTYWGKNVLYHNNGDGTFTDVSEKAGVAGPGTRWSTGCAFLDYDRDGRLDLFVANYCGGDLRSWPLPESGPCLYKSVTVACGPPGLPGAKNILYHNNGDGTFTDVSEKSGITQETGTYGLGVAVSDFDNDGWPDIYVSNDSQPAALYHNNHDGTFTDIAVMAGCAYSADGKPQSGMGTSAGDYDNDGWLDIVKTSFSEDTITLYRNIKEGNFDDVTFPSGLGVDTRQLRWGCGFFDLDNDGWQDIFVANGHIYPEIEKLNLDIRYRQPKLVYLNLRNGRFENVSRQLGEAIQHPISARGCAFGDFDNDGDIDVLLNPVNDFPELLRCDALTGNHWIKVKTIGTKSNRSGIGARIICVTGDLRQTDEVRSGASYASQNDLRVHFGLGKATKADRIEIRWPSGLNEVLEKVDADQLVYVEEGKGIVRKVSFPPN